MGIRIHKNLGYGVAKAKGLPPVPAFDSDALAELISRHHSSGLEQVQRNKTKIMDFHYRNSPEGMSDKELEWKLATRVSSKASDWSLSDNVSFDKEYGLEDTVLFVPMAHDSWIYEARTDSAGAGVSYVTPLSNRCGIWPFLGMVRIREAPPGVWKSEEASKKYYRICPAYYSQLVGTWQRGAPPLAKEKLLRHLRRDYRPILPLGLAAVFWFFREAFKNPDEAYNSLRPMIYVYWS